MTQDNDEIVKGLRFAESIRNLDERSAMKIALALAGMNPTLFAQLAEVTRKQNLEAPKSSLSLSPVPAKVVEAA
jgi:hypothetical protein